MILSYEKLSNRNEIQSMQSNLKQCQAESNRLSKLETVNQRLNIQKPELENSLHSSQERGKICFHSRSVLNPMCELWT